MQDKRKILEITGIKKDLGERTVLNNINLELFAGDKVCLLGPNGAGKTTLIRILSGLLKLDQGNVKLMGNDIANKEDFLENLGYMPQDFNLSVRLTVQEELITYAGYFGIDSAQAEEQVDFLLREVSLADMKYRYCVELSGGMKRRLMLARSMITRPKMLILDEPTPGVDVKYRKEAWDAINRFVSKQESALLLVSHDQEECAYVCNKIIYLENGSIEVNSNMNSISEYFTKIQDTPASEQEY